MKNFLKDPLVSTGLHPHISLAVDKLTPHRETNHAIILILPVNRKRVAMPIDAPVVYSYSGNDKGADIHGGIGEDLAEQVVSVVKDKLGFVSSV